MLRTAAVLVCTALLGALAPAGSADAAANWSVTPIEYTFAPRLIGTGPSAPAVFTLTNTGTSTLRAPEFNFGFFIHEGLPEAQDNFRPTSRCEGGLAPGASCLVEVTFEPIGIGQDTQLIWLREPEGQAPLVAIRVTGSAAAPAIQFWPPGLFLPSRLLGIELNPPVVLTVSNSGGTDLHISNISVINAGTNPVNPDQIKIVGGSCGTAITLPVAGSCTVQVTYTPTLIGAATAELQFTDDVPERHLSPGGGIVETNVDSHQTVPIHGIGAFFAERPVAAAVVVTSGPPAKLRRTWARFRFVVPEARPAFLCRLDSKPYRLCTSPATYRQLAPGRHVFRVRPATASPTVSGRAAVERFRVLPAVRHR